MSAAALIWEDDMKPGCTLIAYLHANPEKRDELLKPILTSFWSRRLDLLQKDVDIQFITMLSDPD